jgi:CBS domain-containing protein
MANVKDLLARKGGNVLVVSPTTTVLDAAEQMNVQGTGSVLVVDGDRLTGIFTERDLMRRIVAVRLDPGTVPVSQVMTTALVTATLEATIGDCGALMSERRIRHLPVVDGTRIAGVVTTGDILAWQLQEQQSVIQQLESFVFYVRQ